MTKDGTWTQPLAHFWKSLWQPTLGKVWDSSNADSAFRTGDLSSSGAGGRAVRVAFRNATPLPLILCWINERGIPHHYYHLSPSLDMNGKVSSLDHLERTNVGHAFCLALCDDDESAYTGGKLENVLGGYRPSRVGFDDGKNHNCIHLVTVSSGRATGCCGDTKDFVVTAHLEEVDPTPLDTSDKYYEKDVLGGWPVRLEKQWHGGDRKLKRLFEDHFRTATKLLPEHARKCLRKTTPFYINKSQCYGPAACPIKGRGMCFHPGSSWLEENGMCKDKSECIEVYKCKEYTNDSELWGPGGVLLHELCHAYHWKMVPGGYGNKEIKRCYDQAMEEGLYDKVKFHRPEGCDAARAYACENEMEYFAELSVAFLAGKDKNIEYNKWQPFNRNELRRFDPRAYNLLKRIWRVDCGDDPEEEKM